MTDSTKKILGRVGIGLLCIALVAYTVFHMVSLFSNDMSTVVVRSSTETTVLEMGGYIFRDETVITSEYKGAVDHLVADGVKLSAGQSYAVVYEQGNHQSIADRIAELDRRIEIIENAIAKGDSLSRLPEINQELDAEYHSIMKKLSDGYIRGIDRDIEDMTVGLGRVSLLTNEDTPLPDTVEYLKAERERIKAAGGSSTVLTAEKSGYFYSEVDGCEAIFTSEAALNMTPELYSKYSSFKPEATPEEGVVAKMVYDSQWWFITVLSETDAEIFEEGVRYRTTFTGGKDMDIPMLLEKKTEYSDSSQVLLRFSSDRMPTGFDFERYQSAEVVTESITGINVPKSATHKSGGNIYVYILRGSVVFERRLDIVYEGSDYYTARDGVEGDEYDTYLQSNDTLILDGKNLFDGRILD
ncbi:MAG: hypothetical protein E7641_08320 [Ruminococcaceae bacterium]|nr:hypothetical protein [Oscillospiraceae bacterium]